MAFANLASKRVDGLEYGLLFQSRAVRSAFGVLDAADNIGAISALAVERGAMIYELSAFEVVQERDDRCRADVNGHAQQSRAVVLP